MELIRRLMNVIGLSSHSRGKDAASLSAIVGIDWNLFRRLWTSSQKSSIGFKSGFKAGQGTTLMLFCSKKSLVPIAVCARALSCQDMWFWCRTKCCTIWELDQCIGMLSHHCLYFDIILKNNWSQFSEQSNVTHFMIHGPPQGSLSTTQSSEYRFPRLHHTFFLPSAVEMQ